MKKIKHSITRPDAFIIYLHGLIGTDPDITNINLFYHSIKHYSNLGIKHFYLTLHSRHNMEYPNKFINFAKKEFPNLIFEFDTVVCRFKEAKRKSHEFSKKIHHSIMNENDWMVYIDLDEFHDLPKKYNHNYYAFLEDCNKIGFTHAKGRWIDRCSNDFTFINIKKDINIENQFPKKLFKLVHCPSSMKIRKLRKPNKIIFTKHGVLVKDQSHHYLGKNYKNIKTKCFPEAININHYRLDTLFKQRYSQRLIDKSDKTLGIYADICKGDCYYEFVKYQVMK